MFKCFDVFLIEIKLIWLCLIFLCINHFLPVDLVWSLYKAHLYPWHINEKSICNAHWNSSFQSQRYRGFLTPYCSLYLNCKHGILATVIMVRNLTCEPCVCGWNSWEIQHTQGGRCCCLLLRIPDILAAVKSLTLPLPLHLHKLSKGRSVLTINTSKWHYLYYWNEHQ